MNQHAHLYLLSDIILALYKSVTVIIGDPTKDKDYQRLYKEYDINYKSWKEKIDVLKKIRNEWDVAHYALSDEKLKDLNKKIGEALDTARKVIMKYIEYLSKRSDA